MPHVSSGGGDDLASTDEVKVYKDEGEEEQRSSENLSEDKFGLITETDEEKGPPSIRQNYSKEPTENGHGKDGGGGLPSADQRLGPLHGYVVTPYPYPNGASFPGSLGGKVSMVQPHPHGALSQLMAMYTNTSGESFSQPPPAHMGIPPVHIDPKTGMPRHMLFPHPGQFPPHLYSPDLSQVQWQPPGYPITSGPFRGAYPSLISSPGPLGRFPGHPGMIAHHPGLPGLPHPAIITPGPKQEILSAHEHSRHPNSYSDHGRGSNSENNNNQEGLSDKKKSHIKKPLNAFMLFMKEQRAKVVAECTLKESAAINQILGRKWHALDRGEQAKYYEMARKEKELHSQLYPGWSARDNYATHTKRKKRKRECQGENRGDNDCNNPKKCRARFGLDQQGQWCKPCRRKKKCIRFLTGDGDDDCSTDNDDSPLGGVPGSINDDPYNSDENVVLSGNQDDHRLETDCKQEDHAAEYLTNESKELHRVSISNEINFGATNTSSSQPIAT